MVGVGQANLAIGEQVVDEEPLAQSGGVQPAELGWVGRVARLHRMPAFRDTKARSIRAGNHYASPGVRCARPPTANVCVQSIARARVHRIWRTGIPEVMARVSTQRNPVGSPEHRPAPALAPVVKATTTADMVIASIRAAILAGRLQPGETLVERRLAEQLGVSKTPVREALIALSVAGLVTGSPNRGCTVREPDAEEIRQAYELRGLIEPWAVARTVRRSREDAVTTAPAALDEADELLGPAA